MARNLWVTLGFVGVLVVMDVLVHLYLWRRLVRAPALTGRPRWIVGGSIITLALLIPAMTLVSRLIPPGQLGPLPFVSFLWMGCLLYLVLALAAVDLLGVPQRVARLVARKVSPETPTAVADPSRRAFLARAAAGGAALGVGAVAVGGVHSAYGEFHMPEVAIKMPRLPSALDGYKIVQISDIHIGPTLDARFLQGIVDRVNALKPDLVALTGDLVDGPVEFLGQDVARLSGLRARDGVAFVTGNHEYYSGVEAWVAYLQRLGVHVLGNSRMSVGDKGPGGASFDVAGIHDRTAGRFRDDHAPDVARALAGRDPDRELVLLAHQPKQVRLAEGHGVSLQLSGHTHGGQLWPLRYIVGLTDPYVTGLHHHGATRVYVNQGTGFWGPPMRVGVPPEITTIVLTT